MKFKRPNVVANARLGTQLGGLLAKFVDLFSTLESSLLDGEFAAVLFWISMKCEHPNVVADAGQGK